MWRSSDAVSARQKSTLEWICRDRKVVSRRYKVLAGGRPAGCCPAGMEHGLGGVSSFAFPAYAAVANIFKKYTTVGEFLAEAIRGGKVPSQPGRLAFLDQFFNFFVAKIVVGASVADRLQPFGVVILQHRENTIKCRKKFLHSGDVVLAELIPVHGDIRFAHQIERGGQRFRGV